ncbi:MAG TPA: hypothetical protein VGN34_10735 [Ktedonobacteraceae bacterium]|jgi:hypothetical protein
MVTVSLGGVGTITHIINNTEGPSNSSTNVADLGYCQLKENCRDYSNENKGKVVKPPCFQVSFSAKSSAKWGGNGESSTTEISQLTYLVESRNGKNPLPSICPCDIMDVPTTAYLSFFFLTGTLGERGAEMWG